MSRADVSDIFTTEAELDAFLSAIATDMARYRAYFERDCVECGATFIPSALGVTCSETCRLAHYRDAIAVAEWCQADD